MDTMAIWPYCCTAVACTPPPSTASKQQYRYHTRTKAEPGGGRWVTFWVKLRKRSRRSSGPKPSSGSLSVSLLSSVMPRNTPARTFSAHTAHLRCLLEASSINKPAHHAARRRVTARLGRQNNVSYFVQGYCYPYGKPNASTAVRVNNLVKEGYALLHVAIRHSNCELVR